MNRIEYIKGDATQPKGKGNKILVHICNDIGAWGKGFVLALSSKWDQPETAYKEWYEKQNGFVLGNVQFVEVEDDLIVANIIGQQNIIWMNNQPPIRYKAICKGLRKVAEKALALEATIHMPRIGCGLAGGEWPKIEKIITAELVEKGLSVIVYNFG